MHNKLAVHRDAPRLATPSSPAAKQMIDQFLNATRGVRLETPSRNARQAGGAMVTVQTCALELQKREYAY